MCAENTARRTWVRTYVIAADPYDGWAKIGFTEGNVKWRMRQLQTASPRELRCVAQWSDVQRPILEAPTSESELHEHFAAVRGRGEWFALPAALLMALAATSGQDRGYWDVLTKWPTSRIIALATGDDTTPDALAYQFAATPTRHILATSRLRSVANAG